MLKKILLGVAALLVVLAVVIAAQPAEFRIERSITITAPPEAAHAQVNDFHKWNAWSPWDKMDPSMKRTYAGPPAGVGATYAWSGNNQVGDGKMTIEKSEPAEIAIELEFLKPMAATNTATFTFVKTADGTKTTWAMQGRNNFVSKAFSLVMNMDELVGGDFERGLTALKAAAEKAASTAPVAATP